MMMQVVRMTRNALMTVMRMTMRVVTTMMMTTTKTSTLVVEDVALSKGGTPRSERNSNTPNIVARRVWRTLKVDHHAGGHPEHLLGNLPLEDPD